MESGGASRGSRRRSTSRSSQGAPPTRRGRHSINIPQNQYTYQPETPACLSTEDALNPPYTPYYPYSQDSETQPPSQPIDTEQDPDTETPTTQTTQVRKRTSKIWKYFTLLEPVQEVDRITGETIYVRYAQCNFEECSMVYKHDEGTGGGTGSMKRHLEKKHAGACEEITGGSSSSGRAFQYNHDVARQAMARYVPSQKQPFSFPEKEEFIQLVRTAFNPDYRRIPRSTLVSDIKNLYGQLRHSLKCMVSQMHARVSLTSDSWTSTNNLHVVGITLHWIDSNWIMQKRIVSFQNCLTLQSGNHLALLISESIENYGISDKILSLTYDNAKNFVATIPLLEAKYTQPFNEEIFHTRCICHTLQLIVRNGMKSMENHIGIVRNALTYIRRKTSFKEAWKRSCKACGVKHRSVVIDMPTRWNTVLYMLEYAYEYRQVLHHFCGGLPSTSNFFIPTDTFNEIRIFIDFLKLFERWTTTFSGCYYPTSHLGLQVLVELIAHINKDEYKNNPIMVSCMQYTREKFIKYYDPIPMTYCLAHLFDPRFKGSCLFQIVTQFYEKLGRSMEYGIVKHNEIQYVLKEKWNYYSQLLGTDAAPSSPAGQYNHPFLSMVGPQGTHTGSTQHALSELDIYFAVPCVRYTANFDVLAWWRDNSGTYPVVSTMARDLLTIQMSSVASESAFSDGRQQLSPYRASISGTSLEMIVCIKDWLNAESRTQGFDKDDTDAFGLTTPEGTGTTTSQDDYGYED